MVRTIVYFFLAALVLGTLATPGLAALGLVAVPLLVLGLVWRIALTVTTHGHPSEAVVQTRRHQLLGPGGPDDSFAADAFETWSAQRVITQRRPAQSTAVSSGRRPSPGRMRQGRAERRPQPRRDT